MEMTGRYIDFRPVAAHRKVSPEFLLWGFGWFVNRPDCIREPHAQLQKVRLANIKDCTLRFGQADVSCLTGGSFPVALRDKLC